MFGTVVENALLETDEVTTGGKKQRKPRYTLTQLLEPDFYLPQDNGRGYASGPVTGTDDGALMVDEVD